MDQNNYFRFLHKDFEINMKNIWKQLQFQVDFCDVALVCDEKQIKTHRIVLSSISSVFRNILRQNSNQYQLIYLEGVQFRDMENLVNFIYKGEVNIAKEDLDNFITVAEDLKITGFPIRYKSVDNSNLFISNFNDISSSIEIQYVQNRDNYDIDNLFNKNQQKMVGNICYNSSNDSKLPKDNHHKTFKEKLYVYSTSSAKAKEFSCKQCENTYDQERYLRRHVMSVHEGIRFPCDKCEHKATTKSHLAKHIESIHEGIRYPCDLCLLQFTEKWSLKTHIKNVHVGIRSHSCDKCKFKTTTKQLLTRHKQRIHEGIRYPCNQCNYKATCKYNLPKHIKKRHIGLLARVKRTVLYADQFE